MEFKEKYKKYKMKYTELKNKQNIYNFLGGVCQLDKKFNYEDLSSVLDYAKNRYECTENKKTDKKYFVILYGPPASGKTIARKLACTYIKIILYQLKVTTFSFIYNIKYYIYIYNI